MHQTFVSSTGSSSKFASRQSSSKVSSLSGSSIVTSDAATMCDETLGVAVGGGETGGSEVGPCEMLIGAGGGGGCSTVVVACVSFWRLRALPSGSSSVRSMTGLENGLLDVFGFVSSCMGMFNGVGLVAVGVLEVCEDEPGRLIIGGPAMTLPEGGLTGDIVEGLYPGGCMRAVGADDRRC